MDLNKLLNDLSNGNIAKVHSTIIANYDEIIPNKLTINILISLCKLVRNNNCTLSITELYDLVIICCKNLTVMTEKETEKYLMSLYHSIHFLFSQKCYDKAYTLVEYVKQHCVATNYKHDMYTYYIVLFNNKILQLAPNFDGSVLKNIVLLTFRMQTLVPVNDCMVLFSRVRSYSQIFKNENINVDERDGFCSDLLKFLEKLKMPEGKEISDEAFNTLLNVINLVIYSVSNMDHFPEFINSRLNQAFLVIKKLCPAKEYLDCIGVLELLHKTVIKDLNQRTDKDSELLNECSKKLKSLVKKYGLSLIVVNTYSQISKLFMVITDYFQRCKESWAEFLHLEVQFELAKMFEILGLVLSKNVLITVKCCNKCSLKTDIMQALNVTSRSGILVELSSRLKLEVKDDLHRAALQCLEHCCNFLHEMKKANCEKFVSMWRFVGTEIYNISIILYQNKYYEYAKMYCNLFYKNAVSLEGHTSTGVCFDNCLGAALHLHAICLSSLKQHSQSMAYLGVVMLFHSSYKHKALQSWILLKSGLEEDDCLRPKTLNQILIQEQTIIKELYPNFTYNKAQAEDLLMCELEYYHKNWASKVCLASVCKDICLISENTLNITKAFILSWERITHAVDTDLTTNLVKTIDKIKHSDDFQDMLCLTCLYFILYQRKTHEFMNKNMEDMNLAHIPMKSNFLKPYEEPPNPNDKCDIVPAYYNIQIENILPVYEILDKCLNLIDAILNDLIKFVPDLVVELLLGETIKQIAMEYRLQHFHYQMLRAWNVYKKYGKLCNDPVAVVTSIGFMLEYSDCKSKTSQQLETDAETLIVKLMCSSLDLETVISYYVNKSAGYLRCNLVEDGYKALIMAEKYKEDVDMDFNLDLLEARLLHLKTCYLMLPCQEKIVEHDENFLTTAQNSYGIIAECYKTSSKRCPYLTSVLLEISLSNGWMYKWLRLPREVRCYTKECVLLAQKYLLPIKTAQFLSLLAFVDLLDRQYDDCAVKLNGLTKILCYDSATKYERVFESTLEGDKKIEQAECTEKFDIDCDNSMLQNVLDIPAQHRRISNIYQGSPDFRSSLFVVPAFLSHVNCSCYKCHNFEYQRLVLESIHLEAILNSYQGIGMQAHNFFKGCLMLHKRLRNKSNLFSVVEIKLGHDECISAILYKPFSETYCKFLLDYSYFLTKSSNLSEARKLIDNVINILVDEKRINVFLWTEVMMQKLNLFCDVPTDEIVQIDDLVNELQLPLEKSSIITPENKMSLPKIRLSLSPCTDMKPAKPVKKLIFNLFDSEDESDSEKPKTPVGNKNVFFKFQTPGKTPGVHNKIKVYTPRTVKPKRDRAFPVSSSNKGDAQLACKTEVKKSTNQFLEQRTRLLTDKLKSEKKVLQDCNREILSTHEKEPVVDTENIPPPKRGICKNLLEDLDEVTKSVGGLSVDFKKKVGRSKLSKEEVSKTKKELGIKSTGGIEKKRTRIKMILTSSSDSSSEDIGTRRSARSRKN